MNPPFRSQSTDLLQRHAQLADEAAANAQKPFDLLAVASVDAEAAAETFLRDFSPGAADLLIAAQNRVRDIVGVTDIITRFGGPSEARIRTLTSPAVFAAFKEGFSNRLEALNKLTPVIRKKLGALRAELTDAGLPAHEIEKDATVHAWVTCGIEVTNHVAAATASQIYAAERGANRTPRSFDELLSELVSPLPAFPATAAA